MAMDKVLGKKVDEKKPISKALRRYVALRNVEARKKDGWKVMDSNFKDMYLADAAVKAAQINKDLVLMEKIV